MKKRKDFKWKNINSHYLDKMLSEKYLQANEVCVYIHTHIHFIFGIHTPQRKILPEHEK